MTNNFPRPNHKTIMINTCALKCCGPHIVYCHALICWFLVVENLNSTTKSVSHNELLWVRALEDKILMEVSSL